MSAAGWDVVVKGMVCNKVIVSACGHLLTFVHFIASLTLHYPIPLPAICLQIGLIPRFIVLLLIKVAASDYCNWPNRSGVLLLTQEDIISRCRTHAHVHAHTDGRNLMLV